MQATDLVGRNHGLDSLCRVDYMQPNKMLLKGIANPSPTGRHYPRHSTLKHNKPIRSQQALNEHFRRVLWRDITMEFHTMRSKANLSRNPPPPPSLLHPTLSHPSLLKHKTLMKRLLHLWVDSELCSGSISDSRFNPNIPVDTLCQV
jgi:hypothetical protein